MELADVLDSDDKLDSGIQLKGNFFIMDTEQLVSNPFKELQKDAANEAHKKNSMTERLTSVKNNICENHFVMTKSRLERQKTSRLKQLHDNSNKLRLEVKLLDLDRHRNHVEVKKRTQPDKDYSYDDTLVSKMENRLGANIASMYLDKKLTYPMRLRSVNDIKVTPVIQKARASLKSYRLQKSLDENMTSRSDRGQFTKSATSSYTIPSSVYRRRSSAPVSTRSEPGQTSTALPDIHVHKQQPVIKSRPEQEVRVKFAPVTPLKSSRDSVITRSNSYHFDFPKTNLESSDEDDDMPEYIDLRAYFFKDNNEDSNLVSVSRQGTNVQTSSIRRGQGPTPKLTTDMLQVETEFINSKISDFMQSLDQRRQRRSSDSDTSEEDEPINIQQQPTAPKFVLRKFAMPTIKNDQIPPPSDPIQNSTAETTGNNLTDTADTENVAKTENIKPAKPKYSWKCIRGRRDGSHLGGQSPEAMVLQALTGVPISNNIHTHVPLRSASRALRHTATFKMHQIVEKLIHERTKYERHQAEEIKKQLVEEEEAKHTADIAGQERRDSIRTVHSGQQLFV
ncbi:uncharacterized protein LOC131951370 isoform X2 [Physella acuta]|uniref:uncharacterized protein LOC131951370 isoform X2 n=1 Tax=Physella acuta TaxID=109671 RepID=UPI0027DDC3B3|nr:uncharacterized protein LOC131951370 isoform X2 [Physella acuta]